MKNELNGIQILFDQQKATFQTKLDAKDKEIAALKEGIELAKFIEKLPELIQSAKQRDQTLDEYLLDVIEIVKNPSAPILPVSRELQERISRIAEMRCVTISVLMKSEDVQERMNTALDNLVY